MDPKSLNNQKNSAKRTENIVYMIFQGTQVYARALKIDNMCMYVIVKGKPMYAKEDTA
jgi:hypothetical protein